MSEIKINITLKEVNNLRLPQIEVDSEDEGAYRAAGKGIEKKYFLRVIFWVVYGILHHLLYLWG